MRVLAVGVCMSLAGCTDRIDELVGASVSEMAETCGLKEQSFKQARDAAKRLAPYQGLEAGRCTLIVDDGQHVSVITPKIKRQVEVMLANEKAGSTK